MARVFHGAQIGKFGTVGRGAISFDWVPSPAVFQDRILRVKAAIQDRTVPLILSQEIVKGDIAERFEGEHDPEGQPWAQWSGWYSAKVPTLNPPHSGNILDWTGTLREAATSDDAFVQVNTDANMAMDSLFYDTGGLPPYWVFHQQPAGSKVGLTSHTRAVFDDKGRATGKTRTTTFRAGDSGIPPRKFLGLSGEAEIQILEVFDDWFQGIISMGVSQKGNIFIRRNPTPRKTPQTL